MKIFRTLLLVAVCGLFVNNAKAQKNQNELVISAGAGYSVGVSIVKLAINSSLNASGLNDAKFIPPLVGNIDYGVADNFSLGFSYTHTGFSSVESATVNDTLYRADVGLRRANIALRPLFHFGPDETVDIYFGGRLGYSLWKGSYEIRDTYGNNRADDVNIPSLFNFGIVFGVRKYFNENIGVNFDINFGNGPYLLAGGLAYKI